SLEEIFTAFNILIATQEMTKRLDSQRIPLEISLVRLAHNKPDSRNLDSHKESHSPSHSQTQIHRPEGRGVASDSRTHRPEGRTHPNLSGEVNLKIDDLAPREKEQPQQLQQVAVQDIPVPVVSVTLEKVKEAWGSIVNNLSKIKMSVSTYLSEGEPTKVQGDLVTVAFPKTCSLYKESLDRKENKAIVEKSASEICNADLRVNFVLTAQVKQSVDVPSNPFIKSALEMFGGRVVKED
ncbi:MAG: hypothetical protein COV73_01135, partial [Candidatus Omnitrophica bacterium CG11_big_fil_rev_8_21_14_0_20_43_6]